MSGPSQSNHIPNESEKKLLPVVVAPVAPELSLAVPDLNKVDPIFNFPGLSVTGSVKLVERHSSNPSLTRLNAGEATKIHGGSWYTTTTSVELLIDHPKRRNESESGKGILLIKVGMPNNQQPAVPVPDWRVVAFNPNVPSRFKYFRDSLLPEDSHARNAIATSYIRGMIVGAHLFAEKSKLDTPPALGLLRSKEPEELASDPTLITASSMVHQIVNRELMYSKKLKVADYSARFSLADPDEGIRSKASHTGLYIPVVIEEKMSFRGPALRGIVELEIDVPGKDLNEHRLFTRVRTGSGYFEEQFHGTRGNLIPYTLFHFFSGVLVGARSQIDPDKRE